MLGLALLLTAIALRVRLALVVLLPWRLRLWLWLRLWRPNFRRTRLRLWLGWMELRRTRLWLLLRRPHFNDVRLRRRTRCFHVRLRRTLRGLGACAHLRRLVVRALLHCRRRIAIEAIRFLSTALRLRLRRLRSGLRQLRPRLEGAAFVVRCAGSTFALWWARRHAGRALRCLHGLWLPEALLRCSSARQRMRAIDRTRRHQGLRSLTRLRTALTVRRILRIRRIRVGRANQPDRTPRAALTALFWWTTRLVADVCRTIWPGVREAQPGGLGRYRCRRHPRIDLTAHRRDACRTVTTCPCGAGAGQRAAL